MRMNIRNLCVKSMSDGGGGCNIEDKVSTRKVERAKMKATPKEKVRVNTGSRAIEFMRANECCRKGKRDKESEGSNNVERGQAR
jgi:hypothetical protein